MLSGAVPVVRDDEPEDASLPLVGRNGATALAVLEAALVDVGAFVDVILDDGSADRDWVAVVVIDVRREAWPVAVLDTVDVRVVPFSVMIVVLIDALRHPSDTQ